MSEQVDKSAVIGQLNSILELELAGVVRYTHYSFMVYGYGRIPIVGWMRGQANESLLHAQEAGEMVTHLGGEPSLGIAELLSQHSYDIGDIMRESLQHEQAAIDAYQRLLGLVDGKSVMLEEYARRMIAEEETHVGEVEKMLRNPEALSAARSGS